MGCSPRKIFTIRHSEIASKAMFGTKTTTIVVSVAREAIEPNYQK